MASSQADDIDYEVEYIISDRVQRGVRQFQIRWKNYGPESDSWEPESSLNCPSLLRAYFKRKRKAEREAQRLENKKRKHTVSSSPDPMDDVFDPARKTPPLNDADDFSSKSSRPKEQSSMKSSVASSSAKTNCVSSHRNGQSSQENSGHHKRRDHISNNAKESHRKRDKSQRKARTEERRRSPSSSFAGETAAEGTSHSYAHKNGDKQNEKSIDGNKQRSVDRDTSNSSSKSNSDEVTYSIVASSLNSDVGSPSITSTVSNIGTRIDQNGASATVRLQKKKTREPAKQQDDDADNTPSGSKRINDKPAEKSKPRPSVTFLDTPIIIRYESCFSPELTSQTTSSDTVMETVVNETSSDLPSTNESSTVVEPSADPETLPTIDSDVAVSISENAVVKDEISEISGHLCSTNIGTSIPTSSNAACDAGSSRQQFNHDLPIRPPPVIVFEDPTATPASFVNEPAFLFGNIQNQTSGSFEHAIPVSTPAIHNCFGTNPSVFDFAQTVTIHNVNCHEASYVLTKLWKIKCLECTSQNVINDDTIAYIFSLFTYLNNGHFMIKLKNKPNELYVILGESVQESAPLIYERFAEFHKEYFRTLGDLEWEIEEQVEAVRESMEQGPQICYKNGESITNNEDFQHPSIIQSAQEITRLFLMDLQLAIGRFMCSTVDTSALHPFVMQYWENRDPMFGMVKKEAVQDSFELLYTELINNPLP